MKLTEFKNCEIKGDHRVLNWSKSTLITQAWIDNLWHYISRTEDSILKSFAKHKFPIIPTVNHELHSCSIASFTPLLNAGSNFLFLNGEWPAILNHLKVGVVSNINYKSINEFTAAPNAEGLLLAIRAAGPFRSQTYVSKWSFYFIT